MQVTEDQKIQIFAAALQAVILATKTQPRPSPVATPAALVSEAMSIAREAITSAGQHL